MSWAFGIEKNLIVYVCAQFQKSDFPTMLGDSMPPSRRRSVAPAMIGLDTYADALRSWRLSKGLSYEALFGPVLASEIRNITPSKIVRVVGLVELLVGKGMANAVHTEHEIVGVIFLTLQVTCVCSMFFGNSCFLCCRSGVQK